MKDGQNFKKDSRLQDGDIRNLGNTDELEGSNFNSRKERFKSLGIDELPVALKRLPNPPKSLYYEGDIGLLKMPIVSVVGSRRASVYTKECVQRLGVALKNVGVCVASGGALGVDIAAHKAAMPSTIGIFASGLDIIYPPSNANFISQIYKNALALSEYPPSTPPLRHRFLERNRIVVALSQALVVAQADERSGSMQSARLAVELGVPLFVLPHRIGESEGTNRLLAEGKAQLIYDFEKFAMKFGKADAGAKFNDEILKFCAKGVSLDDALARFGDKIYEYELDGLLQISNLRVKSL